MTTTTAHATAAASPEMDPVLQVPIATPSWMHYGDMIRILGTIAVVFGHVCDMTLFSAKPDTLDWKVCNWVDAAMRWAVPIYIMLSGSLLLDPARSEAPSKFYKKRLLRIGAPLFFWSAFFMWFSVKYTGWVTPEQLRTNLIKGQPYMHLHFVFRIAGLYAFTPMLRVFLKHCTRSMLIATVTLLLCFSSADSLSNGYMGTELSAFARFAPFVGYYLLGYLMRNTVVSNRTLVLSWIGFFVTVAVLAQGTDLLVAHYGMRGYPSMGMLLYDFLSPIRIIMAIFAWVILVNHFHKPWPHSKGGQNFIRAWANTTLGLYLIHPMFREILYLGRLGFDGSSRTIHFHALSATWPNVWLGIPIFAIVIYILSLGSTIVIMKIPYVRRIAG